MSNSSESRGAAAVARIWWPVAMAVFAAPLSGCGRAGGGAAVAGSAQGRSQVMPAPASDRPPDPPVDQPGAASAMRFTRAGTAIDVELVPAGARDDRPGGTVHAGDDVTFRIRVSDAATGRPIAGAKPAAWLAPARRASRATPGP